MSAATGPAHPPHPALDAYYPGVEQKPAFVDGLFTGAAPHYNRINAVAFLGTGGWYRRQALRRAGLQEGMRLLDVASGTGAVAQAAARIIGPGDIVCCDPCQGMLDFALAAVQGARCVKASAERLPFESGSFDFLSMGYALRHVTDLSRTFAEFHRVLAKGGRMLILEITKPRTAWMSWVIRAYFRSIVPMMSKVVTGDPQASVFMRYFWETIDACVAPEIIIGHLRQAGFSDVHRRVTLGLFSEYVAIKASAQAAQAKRR